MLLEKITVDPANPGQVFACLGLLEIASLIGDQAVGSFDWNRSKTYSSFWIESGTPVRDIVNEVKKAGVVKQNESDALLVAEDSGDKGIKKEGKGAQSDNGKITPVILRGHKWELVLDAWLLPDTRASNKLFKTWAGQVSSLQIIKKLKEELNAPADVLFLFDEGIPMRPIGYDCRSAVSAEGLGYYYNKVSDLKVYPAVDLFALIGLNHARPQALANSNFEYCLWRMPLPATVARAAITGALPWLISSRWEVTVERRGRFKSWRKANLLE